MVSVINEEDIGDTGGGGGGSDPGGAGGMTWIPTYGNFGGNGDNDAWSWADRYYQLLHPEVGSDYTVPRTTENRDFVREALEFYGRSPVDDFDRAYLLHDLGYITGEVLNNVINDIAMGIRVLINLPDLINAESLQAFLYPIGSIPFISIGASVYHFVTGVIEDATEFAGWVGDAIGTFYDDVVGFFSDTFEAAGDLWNGFWGGVNDFFSAAGDFFSDVFGFVGNLFDYMFPVVLDLDGDGVELIARDEGVMIDYDLDGDVERTGWVRPDDGLLAYDTNGDGLVEVSEISFITSQASTDLAGLAAFDTNGDGRLTEADAGFSGFLVWRDLNGDGVSQAGETMTLTQAGIAALNLTLNGQNAVVAGNQVFNTTIFERVDGSTGAAWDVGFSVLNLSTHETPLHSGAVQARISDAGWAVFDWTTSQGIELAVNPTMLGVELGAVMVNASGGDDIIRLNADIVGLLRAGSGNDQIFGHGSEDVLEGGAGDDLLNGGGGSDTYVVGHDTGMDYITDEGGEVDVIAFADATSGELWFSYDGDDLLISSLVGSSQIRVADWRGEDSIETIYLADGMLDRDDIDTLIEAMNAFEAPVDDADLASLPNDDLRRIALESAWRDAMLSHA